MQRALFFLIAGLICASLIPATPTDLRWVPAALGGVYVVLALGSWLDARASRRS